MVEKENMMPLEEAIAKITVRPARKFNLPLRGVIAEGNIADLACFKGSEVRFTVVGGKVAMQSGECTGTRVGKALRHSVRRQP